MTYPYQSQFTHTEYLLLREADACPEGITLGEALALVRNDTTAPKGHLQTAAGYALAILEIQGYLVRETVHVAQGITRTVWRKPCRETTHSVNDS